MRPLDLDPNRRGPDVVVRLPGVSCPRCGRRDFEKDVGSHLYEKSACRERRVECGCGLKIQLSLSYRWRPGLDEVTVVRCRGGIGPLFFFRPAESGPSTASPSGATMPSDKGKE